MTLLNGEIGKSYIIDDILLGERTKRRLEMLGMTNLTKVIVLNNKKSGSIIIKVRGTRFALGKEFAKGIKVKAVAE